MEGLGFGFSLWNENGKVNKKIGANRGSEPAKKAFTCVKSLDKLSVAFSPGMVVVPFSPNSGFNAPGSLSVRK
jgi:hypothetical protein